MPRHVHSPSAEGHALSFQAQPLFDGGISTQFDVAPRSHHALPGQPERPVQGPGNLPRGPGISRGAGDSAVSGNLPAGNGSDGGQNSLAHSGILTSGSRWHGRQFTVVQSGVSSLAGKLQDCIETDAGPGARHTGITLLRPYGTIAPPAPRCRRPQKL